VILLAVLLAGCGSLSNINPNATPIVMFPSRIPAGTILPTFETGGATPLPTRPFTFVLPTRVPTVFVPAATIPPPTSAQPPTAPPLDENWNLLPAGVQWRPLSFQTSYGNVGVLVVRIDPARVRFKVHYSPGQRRSIRDWQLALPSAVAIVNANFFDQSGNVIGLVSADGVLYGSSLTRADAGMFQVLGGVARMRFLYQEPYQNWERFEQAVQGFPVLMAFQTVAPGFDRALSQTADRRTVIAQDVRGRILFIVTQYSNVTFTDLANWLGQSGLEIHTAVCMDGGNSSNLYLATGGPSQFTQGLSGIPAVLAVYPR
jgi:hypothetical protein